MAVAIAGTPQEAHDNTASALTSLTISSLVVPSGVSILMVGFGSIGGGSVGTITGVTLGGSATGWTQVPSAYRCHADSFRPLVDWWYLLSPAAATSALVGSWSTGQSKLAMHAACFSGGDTTTPFGTVVNDLMPSSSGLQTFTGGALTAPAGSMSLAMMSGWGASVSGDCLPAQTSLFSNEAGGAQYQVSEYTTATNPSMAYTRVDNVSGVLNAVMSSLVLLAAAGGGGRVVGTLPYYQVVQIQE